MLDKYAFCISVDGQRYADFCRNCARVGFKQMPARIGYQGVSPLFKACSPKSSYYTRSHHIHCAYNHYRALQEAVLKNFPYVVIYEDDAYPCTDLMDKFQMNLRALQELKEDWGCLVLGLNGLTREATIDHVHSQFMRIDRGLCGSHAYLVRQAYYGEALARFSGWMHSGSCGCGVRQKSLLSTVTDARAAQIPVHSKER